MFCEHEDVLSLFQKFKHFDNVESLRHSAALSKHALLVMNALDNAFSTFHKEKKLKLFLFTTGKYHIRFKDFKPHLFWARVA